MLTHAAISQCVDSGGKSPTNALSETSVGSYSPADLNNVSSSDDLYASVTALALGDNTHYLLSNDYEFNIPSTATICGIEVSIERSASGLMQNVHDNSLRLVKGGTIVGDDKASATTWPTTDEYATYGGSNDLWGTTWTPAEINDSAFGMVHSVSLAGISVLPTARMDHSQTSVYYSMPLPVGLVYFKATKDGNQVELSWSTATEMNNDRFEVESSYDGVTWEYRGETKGAGNSQEVVDYDFGLRASASVVEYFRLKQIDFNGDFDYSEIVRVENLADGEITLSSAFGVVVLEVQDGIQSLNIFSLEGRNVATFENVQNKDRLLIEDLILGKMYFLQGTTSEGKAFSRRFVYN